jgi:hypothetical protein
MTQAHKKHISFVLVPFEKELLKVGLEEGEGGLVWRAYGNSARLCDDATHNVSLILIT